MARTADHSAENVERAGVGHPEPGPHDTHNDAHGDEEHHIVQPSTYAKVIGILMVLLLVTVWAAEVDFGILNVPIAIAIAVTKAVLIILFFMHVKYSSKLVWVFSGAAFVFVAIMFALTLSDYFTRPWLNNPGH
jgi:cytochrome c oxidase subunit 4